jgi:ribosomal protein S18 acetylase RimI-like enzyme
MSVDWAKVRDELIAMARADLERRADLAANGSLFQGYNPHMRELHDRHASRLAEIAELHGWPTVSRVGPEAAEAAWLIVQHAIAQPDVQRAALRAMQDAASTGDIPAWQPAMLEDRIRTFEGRPQRYGTQFDWDVSGELNPLPIEAPEGVDERRVALGLRPLADEIAAQRAAAAREGERAPGDWERRRREYTAWLSEVGWRTPGGSSMEVRSAEASEVDHLAQLWRDGWRDAHLDLVPADLARVRTLESFRERLLAALSEVRVVGTPGAPLGFSLVKGDELYQLYVAEAARGAGVAVALIEDVEARLRARGVGTAWLACAIGNDRAARFYEKRGWRRVGVVTSQLETTEGIFPLDVWRYEKRLAPSPT